MGLPSGRAGQPIFDPSPTRNAGMEFGGTPLTPQASQKQAVPFPQGGMMPLTPLPEALPQFTSQESEALRNRFMSQQFPNGFPGGGGNKGGGIF